MILVLLYDFAVLKQTAINVVSEVKMACFLV